jgi:hypothetical protein
LIIYSTSQRNKNNKHVFFSSPPKIKRIGLRSPDEDDLLGPEVDQQSLGPSAQRPCGADHGRRGAALVPRAVVGERGKDWKMMEKRWKMLGKCWENAGKMIEHARKMLGT